jgi:hypothetical protein
MSVPTLHPVSNLSEDSADAVAKSLSAAGGKPAAAALRATIMALYGANKSLKPPSFSPQYLTLVANGVSPSTSTLQVTGNLASTAAEAAVTSACASILAGQSSESDEYGDVAILLGEGDYGPGQEVNVLESLGLQDWAEGVR